MNSLRAILVAGVFLACAPGAARAQALYPPAPTGTTVSESENNGSPATANSLTLTSGQWLFVDGQIASGSGNDYFTFTLTTKTGVFIVLDSRQSGLSATFDGELTLFDSSGTNNIGYNDNGYDFDSGWPAPMQAASAATGDAALYADLNPGTYYILVDGVGSTQGNYRLKIYADTNYSTTVPVLHSKSGAKATLHMDFAGFTSTTDAWTVPGPSRPGGGPYTMPAFDIDGDTASFSPAEQKAIRNMWRITAEDYSAFDIDVTTTYTGAYSDQVAHHHLIGSTTAPALGFTVPMGATVLGIAFVGSFAVGGPNNNVAFTFCGSLIGINGGGVSGIVVGDAMDMGYTTSHEAGHAFGLTHVTGQPVGIMTSSFIGLTRTIWGDDGTQDDMAVIAGVANGFGYRTDDHGNTTASATPLTSPATGIQYAQGIIETPADADFFSFTVAAAGSVTIQANVDPYSNNLDAVLELFDAGGASLATNAPTGSYSASITQSLTPGTYYAKVSSNGQPGEAGQYDIVVAGAAPGGGSGTVVITEAGGGTAVTEGGVSASYTLALGSAPTANVTITLSSSVQLTVSPPALTFTSANWATPQAVTVTAVDDIFVEGPHSAVISHTVTSTDTNYSGIAGGSVTVSITDNDTGGGTPGGGTPSSPSPAGEGSYYNSPSPAPSFGPGSAGEGTLSAGSGASTLVMRMQMIGPFAVNEQGEPSFTPSQRGMQLQGHALVFRRAVAERSAPAATDDSTRQAALLGAALAAAAIAALGAMRRRRT